MTSSKPYDIAHERPLRVAILRALKLGDLMCFIPAVRALRAASPHSSITLIGLPWARSFARRFNAYFDDFIEFPGWPGLPERSIDFPKVPHFLASAQRATFDLALQCHGSGSHVNDVVTLLHAKHSAGFHQPCEGGTDLETWLPYPASDPEIWRWLRLMSHIGGVFAGDHLEFPLAEDDFNDLAALVPGKIGERPHVVVHIGATSVRDRLWGTHNFAQVVRHLYHEGYDVVLTGTQEERELVETLKDVCDVPTINLCGQTSLGTLGALVRNASLVVCHDTGVSHIAVALETPSVIIYDRSEKQGWPPLNRVRHRFLSAFDSLEPSLVINEIEDLLAWQASKRQALLSRATVSTSLPNTQEML